MKTWEYKIINVRSENYSMDPRRAEQLNRLGDDGWQLVSITSINFKTGASDHIGMVFNRAKVSAERRRDAGVTLQSPPRSPAARPSRTRCALRARRRAPPHR